MTPPHPAPPALPTPAGAAPTAPADARGGAPLLADLGGFWPTVRLSAGVVLAGGLWLSATNDAGAVAFVAAGLWVCGFVALLGLLGAMVGPGPHARRKKVLAFAVVLGKLLMVALAMWLVGQTYQVVTRQGLAPHVLAGGHVLPAVALLRFAAVRRLERRLPLPPSRRMAAPKNG